ncbi:hypothetical protein C4577_00105 [Candidatus Parcubacteria bacterium]|nr:MAG: hypothetical protein C4577_00105 [Candidatus Parcubacteria bacterium]
MHRREGSPTGTLSPIKGLKMAGVERVTECILSQADGAFRLNAWHLWLFWSRKSGRLWFRVGGEDFLVDYPVVGPAMNCELVGLDVYHPFVV